MSIFAGIAARKLTNTSAVIFSDPCRSRWFIFMKQIIVLFWVIIYRYLQRFLEIGALKILYTIHKKTTVSESLFIEPSTFLIKDSDIEPSCEYCKTVKNTSFTRTPWDPWFCIYGTHICNYNIIKFNAS